MMLMRCEYCEGRKTVPCPLCSAGAERQAGSGGEQQPGSPEGKDPSRPPCGTCGGSTEVECPGCLGTGFVDMPTFA